MRWPWVFSIALSTLAVPTARSEPSVGPMVRADFWRDVVDPHAEEVAAIISKARELMLRPDSTDTEWAVEQRARYFRDARNMLAYARKLAPQNTEVLSLLGRVADELGNTKEALEALEACARIAEPDKIPIDVAGRIGAIHIRLGDLDAALRWLKTAQAPLSTVSAQWLVALASVQAQQGDASKAIDTLASSIPAGMLGTYSPDITLATFALAVIYDRDEQRSAAFAVLDQMQAALQTSYASYVQNELVKIRFPAAEDTHYYRGLLYESLGQYTEARAEWTTYAAAGATPWRARALEHVAAIDAQRKANPGAPPQPQASSTLPILQRPVIRRRTP